MKISSVHIAAAIAIVLVIALGATIALSNSGTVSKGFVKVTVTGNKLLKQNEYFVFTAIKPDEPGKLSAAQIRDKFLKHRYVEDAVVNTDLYGTAKVELKEKVCIGRVFTTGTEYLLMEKGELIKILPRTLNPDVPVITGVNVGKQMDADNRQKLLQAFKIIKGAAIDSAGFSRLLSELMIQSNGTIFASLIGFSPVFIIDEKNLERQIAYMFNIVRSQENYKEVLQSAAYIDLRYDGKIFVGGA